MKNLLIKSVICIAILFVMLSCERYLYYHVGWGDFPAEEFVALCPYEVGDTLKFVLSDDSLNEMSYIVEASEYQYIRVDEVPMGTACVPVEEAKLNIVLVNDAGEEITCYIKIFEREAINYNVQSISTSDTLMFELQGSFDIEILNDSYDFTLDDSYIVNRIYSNKTSHQSIKFEIEKGIGISRMTFDDVTYNLVQ